MQRGLRRQATTEWIRKTCDELTDREVDRMRKNYRAGIGWMCGDFHNGFIFEVDEKVECKEWGQVTRCCLIGMAMVDAEKGDLAGLDQIDELGGSLTQSPATEIASKVNDGPTPGVWLTKLLDEEIEALLNAGYTDLDIWRLVDELLGGRIGVD